MTKDSEQLLFIGKHCSLETCNQNDFLPITCSYCKKVYCSEHSNPSIKLTDFNHYCEQFRSSELLKNRKSKNTYNELQLCQFGGCSNKLISPISCIDCKQEFCSYHYNPSSHNCSIKNSTSNTKSNASNMAGLAALKRFGQSQSSITSNDNNEKTKSSNKPTSSTTSDTKQSQNVLSNIIPNFERSLFFKKAINPISNLKADKRVKSERESQLKSLLEREKRGILSKNDKVRLAELKSQK